MHTENVHYLTQLAKVRTKDIKQSTNNDTRLLSAHSPVTFFTWWPVTTCRGSRCNVHIPGNTIPGQWDDLEWRLHCDDLVIVTLSRLYLNTTLQGTCSRTQ